MFHGFGLYNERKKTIFNFQIFIKISNLIKLILNNNFRMYSIITICNETHHSK